MQGYNNLDLVHSFQQSKQKGCLWLGDFNSAKGKRYHKQHNIKVIITAGIGMNVAVTDPIKHRVFPLYDSPLQNISKFFEQSYQIIEEGLKNGNVLVHCYAGVSRSSTIIISYLMKKFNWTFKETLQYVRKKRWVVNPNPGFVRQLKRYELQLRKPQGQKIKQNTQNEFGYKSQTSNIKIVQKSYISKIVTKTNKNSNNSLIKRS